MPYLRYYPEIETRDPDEEEVFAEIADTFRKQGEQVREQLGHAVRVSHAKATAVVTGELTVHAGLDPELAQGIAANPCCYEVIARFAQGPGELLPDRISTHRGVALKILDVRGPRIAESVEPASQDFLLEPGSAFINSNARTFALNLKGGVSKAPGMSDNFKSAVSSISRGTEAALEAVGLESKTLKFFGHPPLHPLAEIYFSQAPMRWGDYVAKIGLFPSEAMKAALAGKIDASDDPDAFRHVVAEHFASEGAEFDLCVQLCTDLKTMPVEDASVDWPQEKSTYRPVARLTFPAQQSDDESRIAYTDEQLSFRPANSIEAHRPLGQVMRARLFVYQLLVAFRQQANGATLSCPRSTSELPGTKPLPQSVTHRISPVSV